MGLKRLFRKRQQGRKDFNLEEEIRITVRLAESYVAKGLMTEAEALKYLNITRPVFERYRTPPAS